MQLQKAFQLRAQPDWAYEFHDRTGPDRTGHPNSELKLLIFKKVNLLKRFRKKNPIPVSGKENVQFPDSPDFENFLDFRTGRDVQ